ncbi:oxidoreductase, partial [Actinosynnema sp. ALI-1.44]
PIVSVQNRYNLSDRRSEDVLEYCEQHGIAFIPWLPIKPSVHEAALTELADRIGATRVQLALAWLLHRSPVILPIPGTSSRVHLEENLRAASLKLSDVDLKSLG